MSAAIGLRQDFDAATLRRLATTVKDADQVRRLLALAAVYDGQSREEAARIGGSFQRSRWKNCGASWRPVPIRRRMELRAGAALISSEFLPRALALSLGSL